MKGGDFLLLLALSFLWGTAFPIIKLGLERFSPLTFAALRFDLATAFFALLALLLGQGLRRPRGGQWLAALTAGALMTAAYHGFLFWGQQFTSAGVAAVIVGLNPLLTTLLSAVFLRDERLGPAGLLGLLLGFGGIVLLASLKPGTPFDLQGWGEFAVVLAIASWALGAVLVKRSQHGMGLFAFTTWQSALGALLLHLLALGLEGTGRLAWDRAGLLALLFLALVASGVGYLIYFTLIERIGPIRVNLVSYIAPAFATLVGLVFLGEPIEPRAVIALLLIALGFALVARPQLLEARKVPTAP